MLFKLNLKSLLGVVLRELEWFLLRKTVLRFWLVLCCLYGFSDFLLRRQAVVNFHLLISFLLPLFLLILSFFGQRALCLLQGFSLGSFNLILLLGFLLLKSKLGLLMQNFVVYVLQCLFFIDRKRIVVAVGRLLELALDFGVCKERSDLLLRDDVLSHFLQKGVRQFL